jgi:SET domain-containing protein
MLLIYPPYGRRIDSIEAWYLAPMRRRFVPVPFRLEVHQSHSGRGLFTQERIPKGSCVIEYVGRPATARQIKENRGKYLFWTSDTSMIDGNISANTARFINHSCAPNCEIVVRKRRVYIFALRTIRPGEEITYDYGEEYFEIHLAGRCRCAKCSQT